VIVMDPYAIAGILRLTGPVQLTHLAEPLTADNAPEILLRWQYEHFDGASNQRVELLDEAARTTFDSLTRLSAFEPARWAEVLGPLVAQRRLMVSLNRPEEQELVQRLGLDGTFPRADGSDFFSLVTQNGGRNKIDYYLHRKVDYRAVWDPETRQVRATATITLRNDAPPSGLPDYVIHDGGNPSQPDGTNWLWLNFYTPLAMESATVDGRPLRLITSPEFGLKVHHGYLAVPALSTVRVELRLVGFVAPVNAPDDRATGSAPRSYRLRWFQQAAVHPDQISATLAPVSPWSSVSKETQPDSTMSVISDRDGAFTWTVDKPG
jgi:hypothetical protein